MDVNTATQDIRESAPGRANRLTPTARRQQLLRAAIRTFAARGIGEASHTAIAAEAGVAVPTVFHYFGSKDAVVAAVLAEVSRFLLHDLLAKNDNPMQLAPTSIEAVLMAFCDAIDTHPDEIRVWLEWSVSIRDALWDSYLIFYRDALAGVVKILARGIKEDSVRKDTELEDAARVVVGLAHMIVQMKFSGSSRAQVDHTVHSLLGNYLENP